LEKNKGKKDFGPGFIRYHTLGWKVHIVKKEDEIRMIYLLIYADIYLSLKIPL